MVATPKSMLRLKAAASPVEDFTSGTFRPVLPDPAKELPVALSQKYLGVDPPNESDDETRLIIRVTPTTVRYAALA